MPTLECRQQMQSAKQMVEAQLQETGQQLMECEALLIQAGRDRPPKMTPPKKVLRFAQLYIYQCKQFKQNASRSQANC